MFKEIIVKDFKGVPYLESSLLIENHQGKLRFSTTRPNVIVGPNGSGKSALLTALSLRTLSYFTGISKLEKNYIGGRDSDAWWSNRSKWGHDYEYLSGLICSGDDAPAIYYRPGHIPGNECDVTHAMMTGYFDQARAFAQLTKDRSSGQQCSALLQRFCAVLEGTAPLAHSYGASSGWDRKALSRRDDKYSAMPWDHKGAVLEAFTDAVNAAEAGANPPGNKPLVLMDEPEQSLDAKSELQLWQSIASADCSKMQLIVATHSLHPFMHPKRFNLIESQPGYIKEVQSLL